MGGAAEANEEKYPTSFSHAPNLPPTLHACQWLNLGRRQWAKEMSYEGPALSHNLREQRLQGDMKHLREGQSRPHLTEEETEAQESAGALPMDSSPEQV